MIFSPQSETLYKILLNSAKPISIKEIAGQMHIHPATIYRLANPLLSMGLVIKTTDHPHKFAAKPADEGLSLFLLFQTNWFNKQFLSGDTKGLRNTLHESKDMEISFIQSRDELMNESAKEINRATKSVDLLRSGGELSTEVMLSIVEAKKRGIKVRMLIQDYSKENAAQVALWQRNGIEVKKTNLKHIRLMLYDKSTLYFMSYRHADSKKDMGIKINYPPFAVILSEVFETWWQEAENV